MKEGEHIHLGWRVCVRLHLCDIIRKVGVLFLFALLFLSKFNFCILSSTLFSVFVFDLCSVWELEGVI